MQSFTDGPRPPSRPRFVTRLHPGSTTPAPGGRPTAPGFVHRREDGPLEPVSGFDPLTRPLTGRVGRGGPWAAWVAVRPGHPGVREAAAINKARRAVESRASPGKRPRHRGAFMGVGGPRRRAARTAPPGRGRLVVQRLVGDLGVEHLDHVNRSPPAHQPGQARGPRLDRPRSKRVRRVHQAALAPDPADDLRHGQHVGDPLGEEQPDQVAVGASLPLPRR